MAFQEARIEVYHAITGPQLHIKDRHGYAAVVRLTRDEKETIQSVFGNEVLTE